ncbi:ceramide-1-phosphate transfer protein [Danio aesculapii]|uniref:ceramide-1-phosphate transfer protein n=1 Tax=Danio aesculapii TaxID=1142201 RepID=UPI0024BF57C4|nr:ceramide-1-phosphate transfer protein [Danio aesculapii]
MVSGLGRCLAAAALLSFLLFLSSLWLPQETVQSCEDSWRPCLNAYKPAGQVDHASVPEELGGSDIIRECNGQKFQVSRLLLHLNSALGPASDVLLDPYLLCWEELIKFMEALGPLVGFFTHKVEEKITLIRQLSLEESARHSVTAGNSLMYDAQHEVPPHGHAYHSVHSMLEAELQRGVVSFDQQTPSGSRTLLRLHRSLLWLQLLLDKLGTEREGRSFGELCREAYLEVLAPHHPWLVQRAAELVFSAMPDRSVFLQLVCVRTQEEAEPVMRIVVAAIREIHERTQRELEIRNMLDLP